MIYFSNTGHLKRLLLIAALMFPSVSYADPLIEGAKQCTAHLGRYERQYAIPTHLLSAIASTESGRYHEGLKLKLPWPWTINANGKGYFFNSKDEAIAAVRKLHREGVQSIDVGCMQVNLYHHPDAFASLDKAFDPETNIAYSAKFLRGLYDDEGTWKKAAADYHSKTPKYGAEYVSTVYDSWYTIIDRLRAARLAVPASAVASMNEMKTTQPVVTIASAKPIQTLLPPTGGVKMAAYNPPHFNSVKVTRGTDNSASSSSASGPEFLLIKPEIVTADNSAQPASATKSFAPGDLPAAKPVAVHKAGPNFIFND